MRKQGKEMISTRGKEEEETRIHHQGLSKSNQSYVMPELASEDQKRWDKHCAQRLRSRPTVYVWQPDAIDHSRHHGLRVIDSYRSAEEQAFLQQGFNNPLLTHTELLSHSIRWNCPACSNLKQLCFWVGSENACFKNTLMDSCSVSNSSGRTRHEESAPTASIWKLEFRIADGYGEVIDRSR